MTLTRIAAAWAPMGRLSIIVPTLDEADQIASTLMALAPARRRGAEVVVVDGGSRDNTVELAQPFADRMLRTCRGRALQLNAGAAAACGEVLLFLHADSRPPAEFDRLVLDAVSGLEHAWGRFDVRIDSARMGLKLVAMMMNLRSRATGIATGDQGLFATRALFEGCGGFPLQPLMEDIAFCRHAKRRCAPICLRQKIITSDRRWDKCGIVRTVVLMWRLRLAYFFGADPRELSSRYQHVR